ncbi:hypothetical protein MW290_24705 [Aquincola tertiaricarbonis]|uniref:Uncharacterized protein n=1 Tax=Aquincola tertiaricarbonis TaxID=391953 RepID=A0ABY4SCL4_AQUTE|nr:hypothetical protein [Aquincola tertiaricarbonis]URI08781.1 hypothetical protein MW290_24705 [Aquincola tertiaricarbonis]
MKVALFLELLLFALAGVSRFVWQRRGQAALGLLVFLLTIAGSAATPGPWWGY